MYQPFDFLNEDLPLPEAKESEIINKLNRIIEKLEHDLFFLHVFLASEDYGKEACNFLEEHEDCPLPFRF